MNRTGSRDPHTDTEVIHGSATDRRSSTGESPPQDGHHQALRHYRHIEHGLRRRALRHQDRIRYVSCRHEQVAASMADAEGRLTGRPGVALVHSGPGALNAMISVGNAYKDCSPMMIISGAVKRRLVGVRRHAGGRPPPPLCPAVQGGFRVESAAEVPPSSPRRTARAMSGARGPVLIEVPEDVWTEKAQIDIEGMALDD